MRPTTITVAWQGAPAPLVIQAATLVDERTRMFAALLPSDRGPFRLVHSGDVKIYQNLDVLPRAYLAHEVIAAEDAAHALALLRERPFNPARAAVVEGMAAFASTPAAADSATIEQYAPEQVTIRTRSRSAALLVLADTHYPGWVATVDGEPAPI